MCPSFFHSKLHGKKKNQRQIASSINISFIQTFHFPSFSSCKNVYWVHPTCEPRLQKNQNYEVIQKFIWIQFAVQFWWMRKFDRQKSVTMVIVTYISWHVVVWQRLCTAKIVSKLTNKCQSDIWCVSRVQQVSLRFTFTFTLTRKFSTVIHWNCRSFTLNSNTSLILVLPIGLHQGEMLK